MAAYKVLVLYNFTVDDQKSMDFVVNAFSHREDSHITLFNSYPPLPEIDVKASPELAKMSRGVAFLATEISRKEEGLTSAKAYLIQNGFSDRQVDFLLKKRTKSESKEIIDHLAKGEYNALVLSPQAGRLSRFFSRGVHHQVLATLKNITVCIAI